MIASVGATVGTAIRCPSSPINDVATARPTAAVRIGNPIATRLPKTSARITIADEVADALAGGGVRLRQLAADRAPDRDLDTRIARGLRRVEHLLGEIDGDEPESMSSSTGMNAIVPSSLSRPADRPSFDSGFVTLYTCSAPCMPPVRSRRSRPSPAGR